MGMDNVLGALEDFAKPDKVYVVRLLKTAGGVRVTKECIKDRHGDTYITEEPSVIYEVQNSPSIYYAIER